MAIHYHRILTICSGINRYVPYPPRSLTDSLGREVEKFDQLYDAMESRLVSYHLLQIEVRLPIMPKASGDRCARTRPSP
jgi:hypothetical protein